MTTWTLIKFRAQIHHFDGTITHMPAPYEINDHGMVRFQITPRTVASCNIDAGHILRQIARDALARQQHQAQETDR